MASLAFGSSLDSTQEIVKTIQTAPRGGARVRLLPPVHLLRSAALSYPTHFLQTDLIASAPLFIIIAHNHRTKRKKASCEAPTKVDYG